MMLKPRDRRAKSSRLKLRKRLRRMSRKRRMSIPLQVLSIPALSIRKRSIPGNNRTDATVQRKGLALMQKLNAGRFFAAMVCFLWAAGQVIEAKETSGPSGRVVFTPLEKAADFNRRSVPLKADGGIQPPSAQTVG